MENKKDGKWIFKPINGYCMCDIEKCGKDANIQANYETDGISFPIPLHLCNEHYSKFAVDKMHNLKSNPRCEPDGGCEEAEPKIFEYEGYVEVNPLFLERHENIQTSIIGLIQDDVEERKYGFLDTIIEQLIYFADNDRKIRITIKTVDDEVIEKEWL